MIVIEGLVDVAEVVFTEVLPIMAEGFVLGFNALAIQTIGEVASPTAVVLVIFMWVMLLIASKAVNKAFVTIGGRF